MLGVIEQQIKPYFLHTTKKLSASSHQLSTVNLAQLHQVFINFFGKDDSKVT
jgi:hypothetical protein